MLDVVIVAAVALGAAAGWRRGFLVPVVAQMGALLGLVALYAGPLSGAIPTGTAGLLASGGALVVGSVVFGAGANVLVGLAHHVRAVRQVDHVLGVPLGALASMITLYVALLGTLTVDAWLDPLHRASDLGAAEVAALQQLVAQNPAAGALADPVVLEALAQAVAAGPIKVTELAKFDAALSTYVNDMRPQLLSSRIAPLLLVAGENLPLIGRKVEFPTK